MKRKRNKLIFKLADLEPLLAHTRAATAWRSTYGMDNARPGLWLVHDAGVYLMSNAIPGLFVGDGPNHLVIYAQDMGPADEDYWELSREAVGGDDFVIHIDAADFEEMVAYGCEIAVLIIESEWLRIGHEHTDFDAEIDARHGGESN